MSAYAGLVRGWRNANTIASLTIDTLFWSKKTLFIAAVSIMIMLLSLLGRLILTYHWIRTPFTSAEVFSSLMSTAVIHFLVVFVTLFYGTALISEEVEAKTLTYLFVRPIPKPIIMAGKFLALIWIGSLLVIPTIFISFAILYIRTDMGPFLEDIGTLGKDIGIVFLALLAYGSLFSMLGAWLKHPILSGLVYAFGWEGLISYLPGFTRKLTITHYVQSVFPHENAGTAIAMMVGERSGPLESVLTLILMTGLFLITAGLVLREKEYVFEQ
jgi:ABC-type transport system involved in multi-copper enzyme maturation permease subunit